MLDLGYFILKLTLAAVSLWIVNRFLETFFEKRKINFLSVILWIIFGVFQIYVEYHTGIASIWTTIINILLVLMISVNHYQKAGIIKLFIALMFYSVWSLIEMILFFFVNSIQLGRHAFGTLGAVISKIFMIISVYILSIVWKRKGNNFIPAKYYFALLFISAGSIVIAINEFFSRSYHNNTIISMVIFSILILFNLIIFEMYSKLSEYFMLEKEKTVYAQQLDIVSRNTEEQKKIMEDFHEEKHNFVNELIVLKNSIVNDDKERTIEELNRIIKVCNITERISNSGNNIIDALINFKYAAAKQEGIEFELKIFVPDVLPINQCDIGVVLGNAIDNAIEAVKKCENRERIVTISIGVKKGALVIVVKNSYEHNLKKDKFGNLLSTKEEFTRHGYGVNSIKKVAEKYNGEVVVDVQDNIFSIMAIMNLEEF